MSIAVNGLGKYRMATVYSILDRQARNWWYHVELRQRGKAAEAREKERESIKNTVSALREAKESGGYAIALRGRHLLFINERTSQSGYSPTDTVSLCRLVGIPVLDLSNRDYLPSGMPMGFEEGREWVLGLKKKWHR